MKNPEQQGTFVSLWPTLLLRQSLPGHEAANRILGERVGALASTNTNLTTDYLDADFLSDPHPVVRWLKQCIRLSVDQYLRRQGVDYGPPFVLQAWANINGRGDYHALHNHPHSYLSGTYYVAVPPQDLPAGARNDLAPGCISFFDPRPQANMTAIRGDAQMEAEFQLLPNAGDLLIWPAWLHHMVHPNASDQPRVSISFNVVLHRPTDHLPQQA